MSIVLHTTWLIRISQLNIPVYPLFKCHTCWLQSHLCCYATTWLTHYHNLMHWVQELEAAEIPVGWSGLISPLTRGVFDFMQRHTDISPRAAACCQGRNWKRRREVGLFLLPVVMLSRCLDTLVTDEVNNMQYLSNARTFQKCFHEQQKRFLYSLLLNTGPSVQE